MQTLVHPKFCMCSQLVEIHCPAANLNFHHRNWNSLQIAVIKIPWALPSNWIQLQKYLNRISKFYSMQVTDWGWKIYLILIYMYLNFILESSAVWCWLPEAIGELLGQDSDIHQEPIPLLQERHWKSQNMYFAHSWEVFNLQRKIKLGLFYSLIITIKIKLKHP